MASGDERVLAFRQLDRITVLCVSSLSQCDSNSWTLSLTVFLEMEAERQLIAVPTRDLSKLSVIPQQIHASFFALRL